jgi:hypothetical protein
MDQYEQTQTQQPVEKNVNVKRKIALVLNSYPPGRDQSQQMA